MTTYDTIKIDTSDLPGIVSAKKIVTFYSYYGCKSSKVAPAGQEVTYTEEIDFLGDCSVSSVGGKETFREMVFSADAAMVATAPYFHYGAALLSGKISVVLTTPEFYLEEIIERAGATFSAVCPNLKFGYTIMLTDGTYATSGQSLTGKLIYLANNQFAVSGVPDTGKDIFTSTAETSAEAIVVKSIYTYSGISAVMNTIPSFEVVTLAVAGNLDIELPKITVSAYGGATGAITLPLIECAATGLIGILGEWDEALPLLECSGTGTVSIAGELQEDLPLLECYGTGIRGASGDLDIELPLITIEATGHAAADADADITLPSIVCYGTGKVGERFTDEILRHSRY